MLVAPPTPIGADIEAALQRSRTLQLTTAADGTALIALMSEYEFDVVLLALEDDPVTWGHLAYIHQVNPQLPIVGCLPNDDTALAAKARAEGVTFILTPPLTGDRLRRAIARVERVTEAAETPLSPQALHDIALKLHAHLDLDALAQTAFHTLFRLTPCTTGRLFITVESGLFGYESGLSPSGEPVIQKLPLETVTTDLAELPEAFDTLTYLDNNRLYIQLRRDAQRIGVAVLGYPRRIKLTNVEIEGMSLLARHLAYAFHNALEYRLIQRKREQVFLINEVTRQMARSLDLETVIADIVEHLQRYMECEVVAIYTPYLTGPEGENFHIASRLSDRTSVRATYLQRPSGLIPDVLEGGETILCRDLRQLPEWRGHSTRSRSKIATPIWLEGRIEGVLEFESVRPGAFDEDDCSIAEDLALQVSVAIRNTRLYHSAQAEHEYLQTVLDVAIDTAIISTDPAGNIVTFSRGAEKMFGYDDKEVVGSSILPLFKDSSVAESIARLLEGKPVHFGETDVELRRRNGDTFYASLSVHQLRAKRGEGFLLVLMDVTERRARQEQLLKLSITDELTGLYNKRYYQDILPREIARAQRRDATFALCYFDLDGFKRFNDTRGHVAGDELLRWVGGLVQSVIRRQVDLPFRYGGDEFVLILPETPAEAARRVGERICQGVFERFNGEVTVSFGIVEYAGESAEELTVRADKMMYAAKRAGGNRVTTYTSGEWRFQSGGWPVATTPEKPLTYE
ncbi:MAG: diguanylate cyclase [Chloracidobacterium sp.]|nr:diguanylate cyclase [Chloracidobacterium sp.]MDW8216565.1 diguanylate cyclase [Acidobacteriota bacterium]